MALDLQVLNPYIRPYDFEDIPIENQKKVRSANATNEIIEEYINYLLSIKGYSQHTLDSYKHDLVWLFRYMLIREGKIDLDELKSTRKNGSSFIDYTVIDISKINKEDMNRIDYSDLIAFLRFTAQELSNNANSRKRKVTTLKGFFRYLHNERHYIDSNPAEDLKAPKIGKPQPRFLTLEQAQDLIDAPSGKHEVRDRAILTLFLNTGLRVSELCSLQLTDIQSEMIHVKGKGKKERTLFLNDACLQSLADYLPIREAQVKTQLLNNSDSLFISQKGTQFSSRGIEHMIEKYIIKIGLNPREYTVHTLRHTAATLMHKYSDTDIRILQQVLGHESTSTTEIYTHLDNKEIQDAINNNPLSHYRVSDEADLTPIFNILNPEMNDENKAEASE